MFPQGTWTAVATINLPASANNNPNVKIGFQWYNDGNGLGSDPSVAIDDITLSESPPLPVTLLEFKGEYFSNQINLTFSTLSEINNNYFEILKSVDGIFFQKIGTIKGHGNSNTVHKYQFTDRKISYFDNNSVYYYRLKQVDFNGDFFYSNTIAVSIKNSEKNIYINNKTFKVKYHEENAIIRCYDISGKMLYCGNANNITLPIDKGLIFIIITSNTGYIERYKFTLN